jgi:hypothetical protein
MPTYLVMIDELIPTDAGPLHGIIIMINPSIIFVESMCARTAIVTLYVNLS